jgi:hypothetical protein
LLQAVLYGYYILSAMGLRAMSPAMALMTSQEAHLSGSFRSAHQVQPMMGASRLFSLCTAVLPRRSLGISASVTPAALLQRLAASAEEVAFNDPPGGAAERMILNDHLWRLLRHSKLSAFQRFIQGVRCLEHALLVCHAPRTRSSLCSSHITSASITYADGVQPKRCSPIPCKQG